MGTSTNKLKHVPHMWNKLRRRLVRRVMLNLVRNVFTLGRRHGPRGLVAEWTVTLAIFFFATSALVQAYVIPTGSMEGNLLVGDHVLVDKVAYADPGALGKGLLPYRNVRRGDIIVFRYPLDPHVTYVKRVIGIPGDRIHLENQQVIRNGQRLIEPYTRHIARWTDPYRDNFPQASSPRLPAQARDMLEHHQRNGEIIVPAGSLF